MATAEEIATLARLFPLFAYDFDRASPLYARIARAAAEDRDLIELFCEAPLDQRKPVLPLAAVHYLLLGEPDHPLAAYYQSLGGTRAPDDGAFAAFRSFCFERRGALVPLLRTRSTQTNEVRRAGQLLPLFALAERIAGRPLALVEVGPSAGLNLLFDRYRYAYGNGSAVGGAPFEIDVEVRGDLAPPVPRRMPRIASRVGIDQKPVDVRDTDATRWLEACIWPEQADRLALFRSAVEVARADPPALVAGNAEDVLADVAARAPSDAALCVFHSFVLAYLSDTARARLTDAIRDLSREREVFWVSAEPPRLVPPLRDLPPPIADRLERLKASFSGDGGPYVEGFSLLGLVRARNGALEPWFLAAGGYHGHWLEWIDPSTAA